MQLGQEIGQTRFTDDDRLRFESRLQQETELLVEHLRSGRIAQDCCVGGFELESWLVDHNYFPSPTNETYLARLNDPLVVPELSKFNVELNGTPQTLRGDAFRRLEQELEQTWRHCVDIAHEQDAALVMIGILPTIRETELTLGNISQMNRYFALNEQILKGRRGEPIHIDIMGREHLVTMHQDVMLEAATTSFQVHLQVPEHQAVRYYNAALILSGPIVAACANSPYLFETDLWDETRIPLFEQAVEIGGYGGLATSPMRRVTFGSGYARESMAEIFLENLSAYPVLLPIHFDSEATELSHVRLHNGTIWRWNRPLIGFDEHGVAHIRIEHRVMPAGPSIADQIANAALYIGLSRFLAEAPQAPEDRLDFDVVRENFYRAARYGLEAEMIWFGGAKTDVCTLLLEELLPMAAHGLGSLGIDEDDIEHYLDILRARIRTKQNGSGWQRAYIDHHGRDFFKLTAAYLERQRSGMPVHEWEI
jgi:hypothetical protein